MVDPLHQQACQRTTEAACVWGCVLQLEQQIQHLSEQRQHVAVQLEQLEGCEGGKDDVGVADLKQQLQVSMQGPRTCKRAACKSPSSSGLLPMRA